MYCFCRSLKQYGRYLWRSTAGAVGSLVMELVMASGEVVLSEGVGRVWLFWTRTCSRRWLLGVVISRSGPFDLRSKLVLISYFDQ